MAGIRATKKSLGGPPKSNPIVGPYDTSAVLVDPSAFKGSVFVTAEGVLIPGTPLAYNATAAGVTATLPAAGSKVFGVLPEAIHIAESNSDADLDAEPNFHLGVAINGLVNTAVVRDNCGGANYSADVLLAFAGTPFTLTGGRATTGAGTTSKVDAVGTNP